VAYTGRMNLDEFRLLSLIEKDSQFRACDREIAQSLAAQGFVNLGINLPRDFGGERVDRGAAAFITPAGREELMRLRAAR
jgi:hypothetical protein